MFGKRKSKRMREQRRAPSGRPTPERDARDVRRGDGRTEPRDDIRRDDRSVDEASEDSFPASDPPSYTGTTGP